MFSSQQIIHRLHWIERFDGNFYKDRVPVGHGAVPQAGKFERFQFASVLALVRDEACVLVDVVGLVELFALVVLNGTNQIDRIEVRSVVEHRFLGRVFQIDLRAFQYLGRVRAVRIDS